MNRNLIFCTVGPGPGTVPFRKEPGATWDLVEVLWHPDMIRDHLLGRCKTDADFVLAELDHTKRKFVCFADAWTTPMIRRDYDAVLIADDDLTPVGCTWSDVFALFHETGLNVAQPALAPGSTVISSASVTHQQPGARWRRTNFVEVMMPIFAGRCIEELVPYFLDEKYGLGLEMLWRERFAPIGVLDATPVLHTRPLGSAHSMTGVDSHPWQQAREFRARHGLTNEDHYPVSTLEWHPPESEPRPPPPPDRRRLQPELAHALALADGYKQGAAMDRHAAEVMQARVRELERQVGAAGGPLVTSGELGGRPVAGGRRRNLVFVARGPGPGTVDVRREKGATWDLVEVLWHPEMIAAHRRGELASDADLVVYDPDRTKRKFPCFAELYRAHPYVRGYQAVALLDDDLEPAGCTWTDIFTLFARSGLSIAQPALTADSSASKPVTYQRPGVLYRETDFVEVMAPIFRGALLEQLVPHFLEERNGWGLEALWPGHAPIGILDATPIRHARPVGTSHSLGGLGVDPERRADDYRRRHGLKVPQGVTLRTVDYEVGS